LILITGAAGLIGRHLCSRLESEGVDFRRFDIRIHSAQDIRDPFALRSALEGVTGVVHLAAVSRVAWAQDDPDLCRATNVTSVELLVDLCMQGVNPWLIFSSSREVYGNPTRFPVREEDAMLPVNVYGESKRDAEFTIKKAIELGLVANICRFTNVYGCPHDHEDRVAMAFARKAAHGGLMRLHGGELTFDFTHVADVVDGIWRLIQQSRSNRLLPPIHFASGIGTTLRELAGMALARALRPVVLIEQSARNFDVSGFVGDPSRASELLGWQPKISLEEGFSRLINDLSKAREATEYRSSTSGYVHQPIGTLAEATRCSN
jgi:UDP-glucose 4-epimerase